MLPPKSQMATLMTGTDGHTGNVGYYPAANSMLGRGACLGRAISWGGGHEVA